MNMIKELECQDVVGPLVYAAPSKVSRFMQEYRGDICKGGYLVATN